MPDTAKQAQSTRPHAGTNGAGASGAVKHARRPRVRVGITSAQLREKKNERRAFLIRKDVHGTLSPAERRELDRLQEELRAHLNRVAPLPFDALEELEAYVRRREAELAPPR